MPLITTFAGCSAQSYGFLSSKVIVPITYVASSQAGTSSSGAVSINAPTGIADGDFLIYLGSTNNGTTSTAPTPPAGWTNLITSAAGTSPNMRVSYKTASSEGASYSFTSNNSNQNALSIHAFRGGTISINASSASLSSGASGSAATAAAITTTAIGTLIFLASAGVSPIGTNWTPPTGFTEAYDSSTAQRNAMTVDYKTNNTIGSTGSVASGATIAGAWQCMLIQLSN